MTIKSLARKFYYKHVVAKTSQEFNTTSIERSISRPLKISLFGSCQFELLLEAATGSEHRIRHVLMGSDSHALIPSPLDDDDLAVVNISLNGILSEASGHPFPASEMVFARLGSTQEAETLLENCKQKLFLFVEKINQKNNYIPTFFMAFFEPSFNYLGDLQDPYSISSPRQFVRELNEALSGYLKQWQHFHLLDANDLLNIVGREFLQDDIVLQGAHASFINDWDFKLDSKRLSAPQRLFSATAHERAMYKFAKLFVNKLENSLKIIEQSNQIKLIICDLDDTLWRGVAAESDDISDNDRIEGWPLGLIEALLFFKARGGVLALCSKNDAAETAIRFERIFRGALTLDDFAVTRINWVPKSTNITEILQETNLLARNTLFIDDNPREVSEVSLRHPEIRCLGTDHYNWRRIVLQAPETQVPVITAESAQRTELVRATAKRFSAAAHVSNSDDERRDWLRSLQIKQSVQVVSNSKSKYYDRAFELINKTNQFNTTGRRWAAGEFQKFLENGGTCLVSSLRDEKIDNGIISVCLINKNEIVQVVLSCRVFGLEAEVVMGAKAVELILKKHKKAYAHVVDTGRNGTCLGYYGALGFKQDGNRFEIDHPITQPLHIQVVAPLDVG